MPVDAVLKEWKGRGSKYLSKQSPHLTVLYSNIWRSHKPRFKFLHLAT